MGARRGTFKQCPCGATYTFAQWRKLERLGVTDVERILASEPGYVRSPEEEIIPPFEMRTCRACSTTISAVIPYAGGSDYPPYAKGTMMRYCSECRSSNEPVKDCPACTEERRVQVDTLAREIFVRSVARRNAKTTLRITYKDQALEAFIASDDFLDVAENWAEEGREKMMTRRPVQDAPAAPPAPSSRRTPEK